MHKLSFLGLFLLGHSLNAQVTGEVNYPELGVRFVIPTGWVGKETESGFIMGSNTEPGFIFIIQHDYRSLEEIQQDAEEGLHDEGVELKRNGTYEPFGKTGIGAAFTGAINGQAAKAYLLALLNPHGEGVTIIAATETAKYSDKYKQLALSVGKSFQFTKVQVPAVVQQWKQELSNKRLAYLYSSSSRTGGYSGLAEREEMWLCAAGYFEYKSNSSSSFDTGGTFGSSHGKSNGAGNWDIVADGNGGAILQLKFQDGKLNNYNIQKVEGGKLYLSGYGYFWSNAGNICP